MGRPALEVADIFRTHGPAWRAKQSGHLSLGQLKVMSAIEQCRTAALGGHALRCNACGHEEISYNSCLMVSAPLWGPRSLKWRESWVLRPWKSPLHLGLQQCDQPIWRPEFALAKVGRRHHLDSLQLLAGVGANVDLGRGQVGMSKPERNLADVLGGLQNHHGAGVPQHMGRGLLVGQRRTSLTRGEDMASKNVSHAPSTQGIATGVDEHLRR